MGSGNLAIAEPSHPSSDMSAPSDADERMRCLVAAHFDFVWRVLRRLGVPESIAEDATQDVFIIADRKTRDTWPQKEKSFLFAIALRVAADKRRAERNRPDLLQAEAWAGIADTGPSPDVLLDERRARAIVDQILESVPLEQRVAFVLFEMEDMSTHEISELLGIPIGTVASRLRRGRELFFQGVNRVKARNIREGAT
jgi:RNA polymerase sigma-70 factor, ECF subfamily